MGCEVKVSDEFAARLDEAIAYRADNYGLRSARKLLDAVRGAQALLAVSPTMGSLVNGGAFADDSSPLRWTRIDSYVAIYRVNTNVQAVVLLTLFHVTSNWRRRVLG